MSTVAIGVTLHNRAAYLPEALDSLLAQSYRDFTLTLVDDGSTDETERIARDYERRDARIRYVRLPQRQGMIAAWRAAFELAIAGPPEGGPHVRGGPAGPRPSLGPPRASSRGEAGPHVPKYFAWGSDHDRWDPRWLERLVAALDASPQVVLAYPLTQRIDPAGCPLAKPARQFDTFGIDDLHTRWARLSRSESVAAGDIVYGLMRVGAVKAAGVFRPVLCPDRLLIAELTLQGQIRQVPEVLWYRRQFELGSVARQRATLFAPGERPPGALTTPWQMHAASLWRTYAPGLDGTRRPASGLSSRMELARLVAGYTAAYAWRHYSKSDVQRGALAVLGWPRWIYKRMKHAVLLAVYHVLMTRHRVTGK